MSDPQFYRLVLMGIITVLELAAVVAIWVFALALRRDVKDAERRRAQAQAWRDQPVVILASREEVRHV